MVMIKMVKEQAEMVFAYTSDRENQLSALKLYYLVVLLLKT